ncbi:OLIGOPEPTIDE TRANSPORTER 9 [Salix purpurea]|uniref:OLIGOPEPTIDE TRANSPORTER 9 n=1 Tax=Salix purpurea TaxID=77065 RepID=A0A9Q0VI59_SALPP|nr:OLIGOPEPTIDE TRANSPORTER 9 [Salix purpurea]
MAGANEVHAMEMEDEEKCAVRQVLGFGWAGLFRRYLVEPGEMWWPSNLVQVSLFRGEEYDILKIINSKFHLDRDAYSKFGPIHMSTFFSMTYGLGFATLSATVMHVLLFNGSDLHRTEWWKRYNYVLSGGLDAGTAFMTLLIFFALGYWDVGLTWWGSNSSNPEGCLLASCPTAKGIIVDGCPAH